MKYSIVVPVYNVENYIKKCVEGLLSQSYTNFEIILVNDGSTDKSKEVCEQLVRDNQEKVSLYTIKNGGPGAARNYGIGKASGDYIMFVDSDDELENNAIEKIDDVLKDQAAELLVFDFKEIDAESGKLLMTHKLDIQAKKEFALADYKELLLDNPNCWNKVYKRSLFDAGKNLFPENVWYEDLRFILKVFDSAKSIVYLNEPLYIYYKRLGSIMNNSNVARNEQILDAIDDLKNHYEGSDYMQEIEFVAIERAYVDASGRILSVKLDRKLLNKIRRYIKDNFPEYKRNAYIGRIGGKQKVIYKLMNAHMYFLLRAIFVANHMLTGKRVKDRKER